MGLQLRLRLQMIQRNLVDIGQIRPRIHVMFSHQTGQRGAMLVPVFSPQPVRLGPLHPQRIHDILRHFHLDLVEQTRARRVQRVVQIKDPGLDMREIRLWHGGSLLPCTGRARLDCPRGWRLGLCQPFLTGHFHETAPQLMPIP